MKTTKQTTLDYIGNALYAFGGLGLEVVWMMMETSFYGEGISTWTSIQHIVHWLVTCILWGVIGILLVRKLPVNHEPISKKQIGCAMICVTISIVFTTITNGGLKPLLEYHKLGLLLFVVQSIYYVFESLLIVLIIAHSTCAVQSLQKRFRYLPFGGIALALTWGLIHILTQGIMTGMYAAVLSLLFGMVYLLLNKNFKLAYIAIAFMFMM